MTRILVDLIHTHTQNPADHRLTWDNYIYDEIHAPARLFDHLAAHGYNWDVIRHGELTFDILKNYDILYINLLNDEDPPFSARELAALYQYLSQGGSIFLIADHTNCYYHAERLNPFLKPFDIQIQYTSALDSPENCVDPPGWISISRFDRSHPTNEGIQRISFQVGGTLETSHGTAFLSEKGFGDYWDPVFAPGFMGDKRLTLDETKEPRGSLPLAACAEVAGGGRLAVVADQNIYGDVWVHYHDNFRHALNIFEWLAGRRKSLRDKLPAGFNLAVDSFYSENSAGRAGGSDFYSFYVNLNREPGFSAHAVYDPHFSKEGMDAWLLLPLAEEIEDYAPLVSFLKKKPVIILFDVRSVTRKTFKLISKLAPDFNISIEEYGISSMPQWRWAPRRKMMAGLYSEQMKVEDITLSGYNFACMTSDWGKPLLQTRGDAVYDIARIKDNLIIFFQAEMFYNAYIGTNEARRPNESGRAAVQLQRAFIQFLKTACA